MGATIADVHQQRVQFTGATTDVTLPRSFDPAKSLVIVTGEAVQSSGSNQDWLISADLLNSTTVRLTRGSSNGTVRLSLIVVQLDGATVNKIGPVTLSNTGSTLSHAHGLTLANPAKTVVVGAWHTGTTAVERNWDMTGITATAVTFERTTDLTANQVVVLYVVEF